MDLPGQPRLRTVEILVWLYRHKPDGFTIRDVMQQFDLQRGNAQRRVNYMRFIWGAVKAVGKLQAHRRGRREIVYGLTDWGKRYGAKAVKDGRSAPRRAAANQKKKG